MWPSQKAGAGPVAGAEQRLGGQGVRTSKSGQEWPASGSEPSEMALVLGRVSFSRDIEQGDVLGGRGRGHSFCLLR